MTYGQTAARVAERKTKHPELFCDAQRCLWRLSSGPCPRHRLLGEVERKARGLASEWWGGVQWELLSDQQRRDALVEAAAAIKASA